MERARAPAPPHGVRRPAPVEALSSNLVLVVAADGRELAARLGMRVHVVNCQSGLLDAGVVRALLPGKRLLVAFDAETERKGQVLPDFVCADRTPVFLEGAASARLFVVAHGQRVQVHWEDDWSFYPGVVTRVEPGGRVFDLLYDDGESATVDTREQYVQPADVPSEQWLGVFIFENLSSMEHVWRDRIDAHLGCLSRVHDPAGSAAPRARRFWTLPAVDWMEPLPPHLVPAPRLKLPSLLGKGTGRTRLATIVTAYASAPELERLNAGAFKERHELRRIKELNLVCDRGTREWRNLTVAEREAALDLPAGYVPREIPFARAAAMLGDSFNFSTILTLLHAHRARLGAFHAVNLVSLFAGIGVAEAAAVQLHEAGVLRLQYIVSVELDAERSGVFAAWLAARRLRHPIVHLQFGDITQLSSVAFEQTLRRIGGGHVVVGGSPCNNLSGRNRASGANGRCGLDGPASSLFFEFVRLLGVAKAVPLVWRRV